MRASAEGNHQKSQGFKLVIRIEDDELSVRALGIEFSEPGRKLDIEFEDLIAALEAQGVKYGYKDSAIEELLSEVRLSDPQEIAVGANLVVAEGDAPVETKIGRIDWEFNLEDLEKKKVKLFVKKGECIATASYSSRGKDGRSVRGDRLGHEQLHVFHKSLGANVDVKYAADSVIYSAAKSGRLAFDKKTGLRIHPEVSESEDAMVGFVKVHHQSFKKSKFTASDVLEMAKSEGVVFGLLSASEIDSQMKSQKSWPASIVVARGQPPENGKAGGLSICYEQENIRNDIDRERAKEKIVFPGETIVTIEANSEPQMGTDVFGKPVEGKVFTEQALFAGKNVRQEKVDGRVFLKSDLYGRAVIKDDRVHVENILSISKQGADASLDLFPQQLLTFEDVQKLFSDKRVRTGYSPDLVEKALTEVHRSGARVQSLVLARSKDPSPGEDARVVFHIDMPGGEPSLQSIGDNCFVGPKELLLTRYPAKRAIEGVNVFGDKTPVPEHMLPNEFNVQPTKEIFVTKKGVRGSDRDPLRFEYRARTFGNLYHKPERNILGIHPSLQIAEDGTSARMLLKPKTNCGKVVTFYMLQDFAREEGISVPLNKEVIEAALAMERDSEAALLNVTIAESEPSVDGTDGAVDYLVCYNEKPVKPFIHDGVPVGEPEILDFVEPGQVLARKKLPTRGEPGMSVTGKPVKPKSGRDIPWKFGFGVGKSSDDSQLIVTAPAPGFVVIENGKICVRNYVEISSDRMTARIKIFPTTDPNHVSVVSKVQQILNKKGICSGIDQDAINTNVAEANATKLPQEFEVARGLEPTLGEPARFEWKFEGDPGKDTADYRSKMVKEGDLLCRRYPASKGVDGYDVFGRVIPGDLGKNLQIHVSEGVSIAKNKIDISAARSGIAVFNGTTLRVIDEFLIEGDLTPENSPKDALDTKTTITGSALKGASLHTKRKIHIDGDVVGASLSSEAEVVIEGQVQGLRQSVISARGSFTAREITGGACIEARGDIVCLEQAEDSSLRTAAKIICKRGEGILSSGSFWAVTGINARVIGDPDPKKKTVLHLGTNYFDYKKLREELDVEDFDKRREHLKAEIEMVDVDIDKLQKELSTLSKEEVENAKSLQDSYEKFFDKKLNLMNDLSKVDTEESVLFESLTRNSNFKLEVSKVLYAGVVLVHGTVKWQVDEDLENVRIGWYEAEKRFTIVKVNQ